MLRAPFDGPEREQGPAVLERNGKCLADRSRVTKHRDRAFEIASRCQHEPSAAQTDRASTRSAEPFAELDQCGRLRLCLFDESCCQPGLDQVTRVQLHARFGDPELVEPASCRLQALEGVVELSIAQRDEAEHPAVPSGMQPVIRCKGDGVRDKTTSLVEGSIVGGDHGLDPEKCPAPLCVSAPIPQVEALRRVLAGAGPVAGAPLHLCEVKERVGLSEGFSPAARAKTLAIEAVSRAFVFVAPHVESCEVELRRVAAGHAFGPGIPLQLHSAAYRLERVTLTCRPLDPTGERECAGEQPRFIRASGLVDSTVCRPQALAEVVEEIGLGESKAYPSSKRMVVAGFGECALAEEHLVGGRRGEDEQRLCAGPTRPERVDGLLRELA